VPPCLEEFQVLRANFSNSHPKNIALEQIIEKHHLFSTNPRPWIRAKDALCPAFGKKNLSLFKMTASFLPRRYGSIGCIPLPVNRVVESFSGMSGLEGTITCPFFRKNSRYLRRTSETVIPLEIGRGRVSLRGIQITNSHCKSADLSQIPISVRYR